MKNILFLFPDQLRPDFLGCYGAKFIETPNIDELASHGCRYENVYSTSPLCVPARMELLTGMAALELGVVDNEHTLRRDYRERGISTWPSILRDAGYYTAAVGKMHFYPWDERHGFGYRVVAEDKRWLKIRDDYYHYLRSFGEVKRHASEFAGYFEHHGAASNPLPARHTADAFTARAAEHFIRTFGQEGPFALMVGFPGPHCPYDPPEEALSRIDGDAIPDAVPAVPGQADEIRERSARVNSATWNGANYANLTPEEVRRIRHHYAASISLIDDYVGHIIRALEDAGLRDSTDVIFASDHGDYMGDHGMVGKGSFYESAMRVPLIVSPADRPVGTSSSGLVALRDVTVELLRSAETPVPDFMTSRPLPLPGTSASEHDVLVGALGDGFMAIDGRWKLHWDSHGHRMLFDLESDPDEQNDLGAESSRGDILDALQLNVLREILEAQRTAFGDRAVAVSNDLWDDDRFGLEGFSFLSDSRLT